MSWIPERTKFGAYLEGASNQRARCVIYDQVQHNFIRAQKRFFEKKIIGKECCEWRPLYHMHIAVVLIGNQVICVEENDSTFCRKIPTGLYAYFLGWDKWPMHQLPHLRPTIYSSDEKLKLRSAHAEMNAFLSSVYQIPTLRDRLYRKRFCRRNDSKFRLKIFVAHQNIRVDSKNKDIIMNQRSWEGSVLLSKPCAHCQEFFRFLRDNYQIHVKIIYT